jgi:hypothetical protein
MTKTPYYILESIESRSSLPLNNGSHIYIAVAEVSLSRNAITPVADLVQQYIEETIFSLFQVSWHLWRVLSFLRVGWKLRHFCFMRTFMENPWCLQNVTWSYECLHEWSGELRKRIALITHFKFYVGRLRLHNISHRSSKEASLASGERSCAKRSTWA